MLHRIELVGEIAFISLFAFGIIFSVIDEKKGRMISTKLQTKKWATIVVTAWAMIAIIGVCVAIFSGHIL